MASAKFSGRFDSRSCKIKAKETSTTAAQSKPSTLILLCILSFPALVAGVGCGVKSTVNVRVPSRILSAKAASFQEIVALVDGGTRIRSLSSTTARVSYRSGKIESGKLQQYRSASGYMLLQRPDSLRLSIQNPLTHTAVVELASRGDDFSLWIPSENKFYFGKNSSKTLGVEGDSSFPSFGARPIQIFQAILPPKLPIEVPGFRIAVEEDQDAVARYYVLSVFKDAGDDRLAPVRKFWIERSEMAVERQQTYDDDGALTGIIRYSNFVPFEGVSLPLSIQIDRPRDGYLLDLEFKSWRENVELPAEGFALTPAPGAERIQLIDKVSGKD